MRDRHAISICHNCKLTAILRRAFGGIGMMTMAPGLAATSAGAQSLPQASGQTSATAQGMSAAQAVSALLPKDFLRQVEANYPKLVGAQAERRAASAKRLEKQGAFDPVLTFGNGQSLFNDGGKLKSANVNDFGVEWLTPMGIKFGVGGQLNSGAVKAPLTTTGSTGTYIAGVKVPLLRGLGINEKAAAERQARLGEPLADSAFQQTRLELLQKAASDYWDWVAAARKVDVARNLLRLAQERSEAVAVRADKGDLPGIDYTEAAQEAQRRQGNLSKAERDFAKTAYKLSLYLWQADGTPAPLPETAQVPPDPPAPRPLETEQIEAGTQSALRNRPELKVLSLGRDIVNVDLALARNQRLPGIDLVFNPGVDTGSSAVGNTMKAGVVFSVPLRQRSADGRIGDARLKIAKLEQEHKLMRQRVVVEAQDAASAVNAAYERFIAAQQELNLSRALEQGERDRFALGDSTLFLVNQRERATAEAAIKVIDISAEYEQAQATFRAATVQL